MTSCSGLHEVSIVVPVYNAESCLRQCLDSLLEQTYDAIEVICVDDGSTDGSVDLLRSYAGKDDRVRVITQSNAGPGVARNAGIDAARGHYLFFLDCDDYCDKKLVEQAVAQLEKTNADIVVLPFYQYDMRVGESIPAHWALLKDKFPQEVFSWRDNPDWLFRAFQNFPWNKMFKKSFIDQFQLRFQEIYLTEDLMFSAPALVLAERVTSIDDILIYHREGTGTNIMSGKDRYPLDFLSAFRMLKAFLEERGVYDDLRIAYLNWAANACMYNMYTLNTDKGYRCVARELIDGGGLDDLSLLDVEESVLQEPQYIDFIRSIRTMSVDDQIYRLYATAREDREELGFRLAVEYYKSETREMRLSELSRELHDCRVELERTRDELTDARRLFNDHMNAAEQKVGQVICYIPRVVQRAFLKLKKR